MLRCILYSRMLRAMNLRLQQAKSDYENPFGNVFLYLIGDIKQLPPVMDAAFYTPVNRLVSATSEGRALFDSFQQAFFLSVSQRQSGDQKTFREVLDRLSFGETTDADHRFLMARRSSNVPEYGVGWKDVLRLSPYTASVAEYNEAKLLSLKVPIARIQANSNNETAKSAPSDCAQGLEDAIRLAKGARVMLRHNLWTTKGLVNGALGTVVDILYDFGTKPPQDMPVAVIVQFDAYDGPFLRGTNLLPILPLTRSFVYKGVSCTRTQFPLSLSWATTIHKSQGITMDRVVVDIGDKEIGCGCTYVALTRVRALEGLVFHPPKDLQRFRNLGKDAISNRRALESKLKSLSFPYNNSCPNIVRGSEMFAESRVQEDDIIDLNCSFNDLSFDESKFPSSSPAF